MDGGGSGNNYGSAGYQNRNRTVRGVGIFLVLASGIAAKFLIVDKLEEFRVSHMAAIHYSHKLIVLPPIFLVVGLICLFGGVKAADFFKNRSKWGFKQYLVLFVLLAPAFAVQFWFDSQLAVLGYKDLR